MASLTDHEPHGVHQTKKATASGWIGSALEYYDFFIYATAASLIFPQIFFPSADPKVAIVASLATYGVGYVARPIGAFFLGHWGDTHGRKTVLLVCMFLMGFSTMAVGFLPTYQQVGVLDHYDPSQGATVRRVTRKRNEVASVRVRSSQDKPI